jgi:opacity protein-like surface antigen
MKKFLLAGIGAAALTAAGSAGAADFPVYKAPPPAVASLSWSGCYGGVNGGGGWARSEFTSGSPRMGFSRRELRSVVIPALRSATT